MGIQNNNFPSAGGSVYECGFSCPSCGEFTNLSQCGNCGAFIDENGQQVFMNEGSDSHDRHIEDLIDRTLKLSKNTVEIRLIDVDGKQYNYYGAKTQNNKLVFFLNLGASDIKVESAPFSSKPIIGIYNKGKGRRVYLSDGDFRTVAKIIFMFRNNPEKYGLSRLKIFQH